MKLKQFLLTVCTLIVAMIGFAKVGHAQSVSYQTYKYGTSTTSMADGYYARPATVTVSNGAYVVTMTIRTATNLSAWPVVVNSIDGQAPQNVTKTQSGGYYLYSYSFTTKDLSGVISSSISINVPGVYKANHNISFKFDTSSLPALSGSTSSTSTSGADSSSATAAGVANGSSSSTSGSNDPQLSQKLKKLESQASSQSSAAKAKESRLARSTIAQNDRVQEQNQKDQTLYYFVLVGGILGLLIVIAAAVYFVWSAKKQIPRH
ncbi:UNVERIFIED_CONTAM: cell surface protein [Limosilactobacillus fermentum]|uniref:NEAT domain-containing protein n=1 Tax=Limosilactobacillus fermentum TaxID=1613 RepID=A0AAJ5ZX06_LIMFE|nr:NEAT domain-containing protein [Limosilactobacillus fermentum]MED7635912.1 cell surface protein [Limosilactobacillus fermentum]PTS36029.1 cell surface protein [Limosilactobacillus fermentum]WFR89354.1 NEAT domain-containing protein [Limosilactobacillus fermentum]